MPALDPPGSLHRGCATVLRFTDTNVAFHGVLDTACTRCTCPETLYLPREKILHGQAPHAAAHPQQGSLALQGLPTYCLRVAESLRTRY